MKLQTGGTAGSGQGVDGKLGVQTCPSVINGEVRVRRYSGSVRPFSSDRNAPAAVLSFIFVAFFDVDTERED